MSREAPILIVDDDAAACVLMQDALTRAGLESICLHGGQETIEWLIKHRARLLLLDVRLPDMEGSGVLDTLARAGRDVPFLVISGLADTKVAVDYMRRGARDYLIKDSGFLDLVPEVVQRALHDIDRDAQLASLQREILEISEREQRRIGQDLHDDLCQRLAAIKMKTQHLGDALCQISPPLAKEAAGIAQHLADAVRVSRALARGLSPVDIGHEGLAAALSGLARNAEEIFQIRCSFSTDGVCPALDHHAATQLFRIAQEAIANAVKHAGATIVTLSLRANPPPLALTIANDGQPLPRRPKHSGLGLSLMHHRAESIGAALDLIHDPSEGSTTAVRVTLPQSP